MNTERFTVYGTPMVETRIRTILRKCTALLKDNLIQNSTGRWC